MSSRAQSLPGRGRLAVSLRTKGLLNKTVKSQSSPKLFKSLETELVSRVQNLTSAAPLFGSDLHTQGSEMRKILVQRDWCWGTTLLLKQAKIRSLKCQHFLPAQEVPNVGIVYG